MPPDSIYDVTVIFGAFDNKDHYADRATAFPIESFISLWAPDPASAYIEARLNHAARDLIFYVKG